MKNINKNIPITNKHLWDSSTPKTYSTYNNELFGGTHDIFTLEIDWASTFLILDGDDKKYAISTIHNTNKNLAQPEGILLMWKGNPFNM